MVYHKLYKRDKEKIYTHIQIYINKYYTIYIFFPRPKKEGSAPSRFQDASSYVDYTCQILDGELKYNSGIDSEV